MLLRIVVYLLCAAALVGCRQPVPEPVAVEQPAAPAEEVVAAPSRIVLFVGDGMGIGQITAALYANGAPLSMLQLPHVGVMTTHEHEYLTTDSAASATAMSTGYKTSFEAVSVAPGTAQADEENPDYHLETMFSFAAANELRTGLVSTSRVNHATPAAFGAHRSHRHQYEELAADFFTSKVDVLIGPGSNYFTQRKDGRDLLAEMRTAGWATATSVQELDAIDPAATRLAALLHPKDYPFIVDEEPRPMALADMVSRAIEVLDRDNPTGWFLLVEGSFVDWCAHDLDGGCVVMEVLDLDAAVQRARSYAKSRSEADTLIVVTADHETSGMSVIDPYYSDRFAQILGGEEAAAKLVAPAAADNGALNAPPPFQHIAVGARSSELHAAPLLNPRVLGMSELVDGRASIVFGHFSTASRPYWTTRGRFYGAHTPTMVSIHAEGAGAPRVVAARDNADFGQALRALIAARGGAIKTRRPVAQRPLNVVLMVGDGMGLPAITAAHYWSSGLKMLDLEVTGLASTHALDYLVNDSAATATALATGQRTRKRAIGKVVADDGRLEAAPTVLELAERRGLATGIVTTTEVTHATPAAFYAHQDTRYEVEGIVADLVSLPARAGAPEVILGGGGEYFDADARQALAQSGYTVTTTWPPDVDGAHLIGLLAEGGLEPASARASNDGAPRLADMTKFALDRLAANPDGFFLLVEGGQIDWRLHEGVRDASVLAEVVDFDDAVAMVTRWARERGDTLVIVTADHDHTLTLLDNHYAFVSGRCGVSTRCGGPFEMLPIPVDGRGVRNTAGFSDAALQGDYTPPQMYLEYAWPVQAGMDHGQVKAPHSANFVPVFASGPWADRFGGFQDQPALGRHLVQWASGD